MRHDIVVFNHTHRGVINRILTFIKDAYADNLISLAIYGSYASGKARLNSDLDLFIILSKTGRRTAELKYFYDKVEAPLENELLQLLKIQKIDMSISPFIVSREQASFFNPLYLDMSDDAYIVYDKDDFLRSILIKVGVLKQRYNFQKKSISNTFLWDMSSHVMIGQRL